MAFADYQRALQGLGATVEDIGKERQKKLDLEAQGRAIAEAMRIGSGPSMAFAPGAPQEIDVPYQAPVYAPGEIAGTVQRQIPPAPLAGMAAIEAMGPGGQDFTRPTDLQVARPPITTTRETIPAQRIATPINKREQLFKLMKANPAQAPILLAAYQGEETNKRLMVDRYEKTGHDSDNPGETPEEQQWYRVNVGQKTTMRLLGEVQLKEAQLGKAKADAITANLKASPHTVTPEESVSVSGFFRPGQVVSTGDWLDTMKKAALAKMNAKLKQEIGITDKGFNPAPRTVGVLLHKSTGTYYISDRNGNPVKLDKDTLGGRTVQDFINHSRVVTAANESAARSANSQTARKMIVAVESIPESFSTLKKLHAAAYNLSEKEREQIKGTYQRMLANTGKSDVHGSGLMTINKLRLAIDKEVSSPAVAALLSQTLVTAERMATVYQGGVGAVTDTKLKLALDMLNPAYAPNAYSAVLDNHEAGLYGIGEKMRELAPVIPGESPAPVSAPTGQPSGMPAGSRQSPKDGKWYAPDSKSPSGWSRLD